ncbi:PD40 domain-containing protein [Massilia sp. UMI-21]|nr:PD40 domain-containing protein [Massilia sp. UMI-21]
MLSACQAPGGRIDQLNKLRGPTHDLTVELREGTNMAAAPSPDGRQIVFSAQGALWIMPREGGQARRITGWRVEPTAPVWSPDGKRIAFQNYAPEGNFHIWTVSPDGRHLREHTTGPFDDREPAWLPDGSGLVFSSDRGGDGQYKIWRVAIDGGAPVQVTQGAGAESNPVVSPDGTRLAYVDGANVLTAPLSGGTPTVVAPGAPGLDPGRQRAGLPERGAPAGGGRRRGHQQRRHLPVPGALPAGRALPVHGRRAYSRARRAGRQSGRCGLSRRTAAAPPGAGPGQGPRLRQCRSAQGEGHQRAGAVAGRTQHRLRRPERRLDHAHR